MLTQGVGIEEQCSKCSGSLDRNKMDHGHDGSLSFIADGLRISVKTVTK